MPTYFAFQNRLEAELRCDMRLIEDSIRMRNSLDNSDEIDFDGLSIVRWADVGMIDYELDKQGNLVALYDAGTRDMTECGYVVRLPIINS